MDFNKNWLCIIIFGLLVDSCTYRLAPDTTVKCKPDVYLNKDLNLLNSDGTANLDTAHIMPGFNCIF